jgi:hypothetical protein
LIALGVYLMAEQLTLLPLKRWRERAVDGGIAGTQTPASALAAVRSLPRWTAGSAEQLVRPRRR